MDDKKFIGPYEVLGISVIEMKTPSGGEIVRVQFATAATKIMPKRTFDLLVSPEPTDLTSNEEKLLDKVCSGMFDYMKEWDLTAIQLETLLVLMSRVGKGMYDKAAHTAFTKEVYGTSQIDTWQRGGQSFTDYRTLLECEMIVKQNEQKQSAPENNAG